MIDVDLICSYPRSSWKDIYDEVLRTAGANVSYITNDPEKIKETPMARHYPHKTTEIKKVIFSNPATIVFWADGSKTVVKAHNEEFDPEKGLAMAVCKRLYGDKYHYIFKQALKEYKEKELVIKDFEGAMAKTRETIQALAKELNAGKENK